MHDIVYICNYYYVGGGIWRCKWHVISTDDHEATRSFLVLACMHQGCLVVELDITIIISSSSSSITSPPHRTEDHPMLQPICGEVRQYSVSVKAKYQHNTSYPGSTIEGSSAHLLYGIAVIHCAVEDDSDGTLSADMSETTVNSSSDGDVDGDGSSNLVLAACYFYDNLIEVLRVQLL